MIRYKDILFAHEKHGSDKAYIECILSIKNTWKELDAVLDFVRRWNSRVPVGRNIKKIRKVLIKTRNKFKRLEKYKLETINLESKNGELIKEIFETLYKTVLKSTGTAKCLHALNRELFVMWDKGICIKYGCFQNAAGYLNFLKIMQKNMKALKKQCSLVRLTKKTGRTIPKLLDEYNWYNFKTSKMK